MIDVYEYDNDNNGVLPIYEDSQRFFDVLEKILNYAHNVKSLCDMNEENQISGIRAEIKDIAPIDSGSPTDYHRNSSVIIVGKTPIIDGYVNESYWNMVGRKAATTKQFKQEVSAKIPYSIKFDTTIDAQTFIDLYRTNVVKNIIYMLKYDQHSGHTHIPYFDPKVIKTEDDVLDALGITDETHRQWMKRDVYDYREKDFIKYGEWIDC